MAPGAVLLVPPASIDTRQRGQNRSYSRSKPVDARADVGLEPARRRKIVKGDFQRGLHGQPDSRGCCSSNVGNRCRDPRGGSAAHFPRLSRFPRALSAATHCRGHADVDLGEHAMDVLSCCTSSARRRAISAMKRGICAFPPLCASYKAKSWRVSSSAKPSRLPRTISLRTAGRRALAIEPARALAQRRQQPNLLIMPQGARRHVEARRQLPGSSAAQCRPTSVSARSLLWAGARRSMPRASARRQPFAQLEAHDLPRAGAGDLLDHVHRVRKSCRPTDAGGNARAAPPDRPPRRVSRPRTARAPRRDDRAGADHRAVEHAVMQIDPLLELGRRDILAASG